MKRAIVFPGQGSQSVGMGKELAANFGTAKLVFEEVDSALSQNLSRIMFDGPEADLTLTENAQPAIMASSIALLRVLEQETGFNPTAYGHYFAGHSLGEYTALAAAGSLTLADTARLLKTRGKAMQKAVPVGEGAMAAILGLEFDQIAAIVAEASETGICAIANDNSPGQVVVSGTTAAVNKAVELAKEKGAKRSVLLPVSAPFHSPMMQPAADVMAGALATVTVNAPSLPVIANVTAQPVNSPDDIRKLLVEQVTGMVRWRESMLQAATLGVTQVLEIGVGKVLTGLAKRIDKNLEATCVASVEDIKAFKVAA
ncbi:MAG TPA: ACP S-malonyltransferase [Rickettsiales bacterium]|nr:ACP S-malonyltransferase [Rickettsiales bacterium]